MKILLLLFISVAAELVCRCTDTEELCITNAVCNPSINCLCQEEYPVVQDVVQLLPEEASSHQNLLITASSTDNGLLTGAGIGAAAGIVMIIAFVSWLVYYKSRQH